MASSVGVFHRLAPIGREFHGVDRWEYGDLIFSLMRCSFYPFSSCDVLQWGCWADLLFIGSSQGWCFDVRDGWMDDWYCVVFMIGRGGLG